MLKTAVETCKYNIQIVDDVTENLNMLLSILTKQGYDVRVAINGELALKSVRKNPPDLILLDIVMPGMSGYEVCEHLKADKRTCDIPVIFISALPATMDKVKAFSIGGADYIIKPFQEDEVLARVATHLALGKLQKTLREKNRQLHREISMHRQSHEKLRKLNRAVEQSGSSIVITDTKGAIEYVNPAFCETTGYTFNEAKGQNPRVLKSGEHPPEFYKDLWRIISNGGTWKGEFINKCKDGTLYWEYATISPVKDSDLNITHYIAVKDNITKRKQMEVELKMAKETAESANRAKSEFLANMSHEIRTPMNVILGFTEILEGKIRNEQHRQYLALIQSSGKSLMTLINDILDLSKIEAGKMKLEYKPVSPVAIFKEIAGVFSQEVEKKCLKFTLATDFSLPEYLLLDEIRFRQILLNLVGNAVKFTQSGTVKLTAKTKICDRASGTLDFIFAVEDTGIGIPEEQQKTIFGAFEQQSGQDHATYGGTGLGLAISGRLAEMMGGAISVSGAKDRGSVFTVTLKNVRKVERDGTAEGQTFFDVNWDGLSADSINFDKAKILIADDITNNRKLLRACLRNYQFEFIEAENGRSAIELAKGHHPDLILMDWKMPVTNGREATQTIKACEETSDIPIIAVTAAAMREDRKEISSLCDGYLSKPIKQEGLIAELARFLKYSVSSQTESQSEPAIYKPDAETMKTGTVKKKPEADSHKQLTAKDKKCLQGLIIIMAEQLMPQWETIGEVLIYDEIEELADKVENQARKYDYPPLIEWAVEMRRCVKFFDVEAIPKRYEQLPIIMEDLKNRCQV